MLKQSLLVVSFTAVVLFGGQPAAASPIISIGAYTPTSPTFTVPIVITGAEDLVTWQFDLAFDPADLQALSVSEGPFTSGDGQFLTLFIPGVIDNVSGLISLVAGGYLDLPPGPSGNGILAYVEFSVLGTGDSPITVLDASGADGSNPVPEPTALVLLASGLGLLKSTTRGRKRG
jgi:general secretion pathway protein D